LGCPGAESNEAGLVQPFRRQNPLQVDGTDGSNLSKPQAFSSEFLELESSGTFVLLDREKGVFTDTSSAGAD
jgi:hypothetical protein